MQLQANKYYRTRDGRKAFVAAVCINGTWPDSDYQAIGWCDESPEDWMPDGIWDDHENPSDRDLVAEWRESPPVDVTVYLFSDGTTSLVPGREDVIARKTVTITEGEGMS